MSLRRKNRYQQSHRHYWFGRVSPSPPTPTKELSYSTHMDGLKKKKTQQQKMQSQHPHPKVCWLITHFLTLSLIRKSSKKMLQHISLNEFDNFFSYVWILLYPLFLFHSPNANWVLLLCSALFSCIKDSQRDCLVDRSWYSFLVLTHV